MELHPSLTPDKIYRAAKRAMMTDGGIGYCTACGRKAKGFVEPDAEGYTCGFKSCGKPAVYGAEQLLLLTVG